MRPERAPREVGDDRLFDGRGRRDGERCHVHRPSLGLSERPSYGPGSHHRIVDTKRQHLTFSRRSPKLDPAERGHGKRFTRAR